MALVGISQYISYIFEIPKTTFGLKTRCTNLDDGSSNIWALSQLGWHQAPSNFNVSKSVWSDDDDYIDMSSLCVTIREPEVISDYRYYTGSCMVEQ